MSMGVKVSALFLVDVLGALAVLAIAWVGVWQGVLSADETSTQIKELSTAVNEQEHILSRMKTALESQREAHLASQATLGERDLLPEETPVENDLRAISDLAQRNSLELTEFTPQGSANYPGIEETRYRLQARGQFARYLGFLRDFQQSASWADITYLKLTSSDAQTQNDKAGDLIFSLYSATNEEPGPTDAGGAGKQPRT